MKKCNTLEVRPVEEQGREGTNTGQMETKNKGKRAQQIERQTNEARYALYNISKNTDD